MKRTVRNKIAKNKFLLRISICIPIFLLIFLKIIYATYINKGDLNGDNEVDYADVSLLELHLINSKQLPEDKLKIADINNDGKITVTDLTLLIKKIEETLDYEVTLRDVEVNNYYPTKNENIKLSFNADVTYGESIKNITINGKEYDLEKNESNEKSYEVTINVGETSGVKEYKIEKVVLTNEKEIEMDNTVKVDVLRTMPTVENWKVEEDIQKSELNISFDIKDIDQAFESGAYRIIEDKGENINQEDGEICISSGSVVLGNNKINVKVEEDKDYKIILCIKYNLDTNTLEQEGENEGTTTIENNLSFVIDYKFELSNIKTYKEKDEIEEEEKEFKIGENIILKFNSENITTYEPKTAIINGKTYELTKEDNIYKVYVDGITTVGNQTINIEKITLDNGKTFEVNKSVEIKVIKNTPTVVRGRYNENKQQNSIQAHIYIKDIDKAITNLIVKVFDEKDNEISSKNLTETLIDENLVKETEEEELQNAYYINTVLDTNIDIVTSIYKIKVFADYKLSESGVYTNELLSEDKVEVAPVVRIENVEVSKKYPEKGDNITLTYRLETNKKDIDITHIRVNNLKCIATKHIDNDENVTYSVTLNVGQKAGILDLETTDFTFEGGLSYSTRYNVKVDVLKDKPTSEAFLQDDDIENRTVTLTANIVDPDNAFIAGLAELVRNSDGKIIATETFNAEKVTFKIDNIELNTEYTLVAKMTYDRDSGNIEEETNQNYVENEIFRTRPIQLIGDYKLEINNIKTYNKEKETKYFERGQEITVSFDSTNETDFFITHAVINGKQYKMEKEGKTYKTNIPVVSTFGPKTITIEKVILNNTKEIEFTENNQTRVGILKLRPTITNFGYEENEDNTIHVTFEVTDLEETITGGKIVISGENGENIKEEPFSSKSTEITFDKNLDEEYQVKIIADYDLDTNQITTGDNEYKSQELLSEVINISTERFFEIKDIIGVSLYKEGSTLEVTSLTEDDLSDLSKYIVKVRTKGMPLFYAEIKEYEITENGELNFILDYDNVIQYSNGRKQNKLKVTYCEECHDGVFQNKSIETLIGDIKANPTGTFELTQDYDASFIKNADSAIIAAEFNGTLNGNGHKIYNLKKPLFNTLEGATIKDLILEDVTLIGGASKGSLANTAKNATITNVHVKGLDMTTGTERCGGIIGDVQAGCTIENSSVTGVKITTSGHIRVAGIAGYMTGGTIRNCYVEGTIDSKQSKDGNGIGGIVGHAYGTDAQLTIENCISKVDFNWTGGGPRLNGGILGLSQSSNTILKNNVSLATGTVINKICGSGFDRTSTNNYELEESTLVSNASNNAVKTVAKNDFTKEFLKNNANFDENIWDLEGASYNKLPHLKNDDPNKEMVEKPEEEIDSNLYIPEYDRIKDVAGFKTNRLITYHNLQKLMPYYDAKYLVIDGGAVSNDDILNTKVIKHILPYAENKLVTYLTSKDNDKITSIKVIFSDYTVKEYEVKFEEFKQNIAIYKIEDTKLRYAFGSYVVQEEASIVKTLADYIKNVNYTETLDPLTEVADSRIYKDYYNEVIKAQAENIALQFLQNAEESVMNINNSILINKIQKELIDSGKINKWLYGYNYYDRWYGMEISGAKVSDIMLFEGKMYSDSMTIDNLANETLVGSVATNNTHGFYNANLSKYTGSSALPYFLDYIISNIGGYEDVNDWFTEYFGTRNILSEISVDGRPDILYRGWYQLKKNQRMILPVATMPEASTYLITGPAHFQIGPAQLYHKNPETAAGRAEVVSKVKAHSTLVKRHFTTLAGSFDSGKWNNYCIMCYDCTKGITGYREGYITIGGVKIPTGKIVPVYTQGRVGANQNFFKNFSEVFNLWQPTGSAGGVGNTAGFLWFIAQPGLTNYDTWTHEFEHALADKIMLFQRGMRLKMEIMTQGNVEQRDDWSENNLVQDVGPYYFNTSFYLNKEGNATQNLTPERINTKEKLENYYKGQQNALDLLDYVEGKAFIKLTPEQQAKIATQMTQVAGRSSWGGITAEQATTMNLTSLEALYDNRIMLRPNNAWGVSVRGLTVINSIGADDYGYESIWVNRWYLGHWDGGYADAFSSKRNLFEMLGYAGVAGYVTYGSRASSSDLDAIRKITQSVTGTAMDWRQYKMSRYATVEENIASNKYIDIQYMIDRFTEALKNDANNGDRNISQRTNLRKIYYHYLKSATNDFIDDPLGTTVEVNHIKTAQELVEKINSEPYGYYVLDNDIDFSEMTTNVTQTFMGRLDGNGHKIIGNKIPVFNKIRYGYVGNLVMENTNIPTNITNAGALAYKIESSTAEKISATGLKMYLGNKNDLSLIGGAVSNVITRDCTVERLVTKISNKNEFIEKLNAETGGLFELTNDIDFTGYTATTNTVIAGTFTGKLQGNGHTISNLTNLSLFDQFNGTVENLNMTNCTNTKATTDWVGIFALKSSNAKFINMKFRDVTVQGRNNVAVVVAVDNSNSIFDRISIKNANLSGTGVYIAGLVGRKYGGSVTNVYVEGNLSITAVANAGIIGSTETNVAVSNVISNVNIERTSDSEKKNRKQNAGVVGLPNSNTSRIKNSLAFGNMSGYQEDMVPSKFIYADATWINTMLTRCYEYSESTGTSNATTNTTGHLDTVSKSDLNKDFYKNLEFDETIWDLDNINAKGYPELK